MLGQEPSFTQQLMIVSIPATIAAVASVGAVWMSRVNRRKLNQIQETSDEGVALGTEAVKKVDTGNGKDLGETVHDIAQTVELQAALAHTNTRELLQVAHQQEMTNTRIDEHNVLLGKVTDKLEDHLQEVSVMRPMMDQWVTNFQEHIEVTDAIHQRLLDSLARIEGEQERHDPQPPETGVAE